jgi:hypothetical protein
MAWRRVAVLALARVGVVVVVVVVTEGREKSVMLESPVVVVWLG